MKKGVSQFANRFATFLLFAIFLVMTTSGCRSSKRTQSVGLEDFANHTQQNFTSHQVAKPATQSRQSQQAQYELRQQQTRSDSRYPVQQASYQYPATNAPGQPPAQIRVPQYGSQNQFPYSVLPSNQPVQARLGQPQVQPYQLQTPPIQTRQFQQFQTPQNQFQQGFQPPNIQLPPNNGQDFFSNQANPGFVPANIPQTGLPQVGVPQQGFPPNGFQQPGFQQPGFAQPTFIPPGNMQPGLPQQESLDLDVFVPQNPSGRLSAGGTYSSDNSFLGQIILEEHDFDIRAWPRSVREAFGPRAWRGGGQRFRLEAVPGSDLQRYLVSWSDPYFRGTDTSLSLSGYLFNRDYFDWDERRVGGRISVGRRLSEQLTFSAGLRLEEVKLDDPRLATSPQLNANLGKSNHFVGNVGFVYDNRVFPYLTGLGTYLGLTFSQAFGDYSYSRGEIDFRNHQTIFSRPDRNGQESGRHIIGFRSKLGFTGGDTPVFENFFAGGISSLRGFDYRGISPLEGGVRVGGEFQWLNSLEYTFPLTNDDMISGALFVDFGTVEQDIELNSENFRVAPGLGLRVHLPYAGLGAPLAFDFAFPVATGTGDEEKSFSFFVGMVR